jgi:hypothetical protein
VKDFLFLFTKGQKRLGILLHDSHTQPKTFFGDNIVPLQREIQILVGSESEMVGGSGGYLSHPKTSFTLELLEKGI